MEDLSPEAAALLRAHRGAFRPQAADRERVFQSLTRALGENAVLGGAGGGATAKSAHLP